MTTRGLWGRIHSLLLLALLGGCAASPPAPVEDRAAGPAAQEPHVPAEQPAVPAQVRTFPAPHGSGQAVTAPAEQASLATAPDRSTMPPPAPPREPEAGNPAVVALLNRANQESGAGRHDTAAASLERAIKIEPGNPWLWHRLAVTRLAQGRAGEAASLAAKSTALAAGDPALQAENWLVIARVHRARGEEVAARAAEQRAHELAAKSS